MSHAHAGHSHAPVSFGRAFAVGAALNVVYVVVEAVYGFLSGSLALVADAGHNLSDVFGLLLAWGAAYLATRPPTPRRTYGLRRSSVLAAMFNAVFLLVAIGAIAWEAIRRFERPEPVAGGTVMIVAGLGILVNGFTAMMFAKGQEGDINVRGAFLHMAADALVSLAVVAAGFAMRLTGRAWIDPAMSLLVVAVIAWSTWGLLRQSFDLALDAVPEGIDPSAVRDYLAGQPGVVDVHDLHIWAMSTTETAPTVHLVCPGGVDDERLRAIGDDLHDRFGIEHPTIQVERGGQGECPMAPKEVL
ncbi:MAG: cation transporter [Myxococcales bacterium]|nr:MAG: cation transporter [Myxococcales bacterium]